MVGLEHNLPLANFPVQQIILLHGRAVYPENTGSELRPMVAVIWRHGFLQGLVYHALPSNRLRVVGADRVYAGTHTESLWHRYAAAAEGDQGI